MAELATRGGAQACPSGTIPVWPIHDGSEEQGLLRTLHSGKWWRIPGAEVDQFERDFAAFHEVAHALAVTNGTQALEIALRCMDVGVGDEVIIPAFSFASTITAVVAVGALPVTVDVDLDTYCISAGALSAAITPRTKAIIAVHLAGQACEMSAILELARKHKLKVLSDAAHAHGARYRGESLAKLCDAAIYSFQSGKLMTAGEGGAIVSDDPAFAEQAWLRHSCGRKRSDKRYDHPLFGTNARMSEFQGAILRAQLARFPEQLEERERAAERLDGLLAGLDGLFLQQRNAGTTRHAHYMYMVRVDEQAAGLTRDELVDNLVAEGVPAFRSYQALCDLGMFAQPELFSGRLPDELAGAAYRAALTRHPATHSRALARHSLWLHHAVLLGGERVQRAVAHAFDKVLSLAPAHSELRVAAE